MVVGMSRHFFIDGHASHPMNRLTTPVALLISFSGLEGMERHLPRKTWVAPIPGIRAFVTSIKILEEQVICFLFLHTNEFPTFPVVKIFLFNCRHHSIFFAFLPRFVVRLQTSQRYHLYWAMHPSVAIVQENWLRFTTFFFTACDAGPPFVAQHFL